MKKSLFYLAATLLIATTSCSEDNNDDDPKGQESNITLYAPDDLEEFDLLYENPTRKLNFAAGQGSFVFTFDRPI